MTESVGYFSATVVLPDGGLLLKVRQLQPIPEIFRAANAARKGIHQHDRSVEERMAPGRRSE